MAQNISCELISYTGKSIKKSDLNFALISSILWDIDEKKAKYPWLHSIDEYGDTIFNHLQCPIVVEELKQLKNEGIGSNQELINQFIDFIDGIELGQYIRFIGD